MSISIINDWKAECILLNVPASASAIADCESAINFHFPEDVKQFYKICNGFADSQLDSKLLNLWPLQMITLVNMREEFIAFADYNVNGSQIGYLRGKPGVYHDYNKEKFCESFNDFLEHWKNDSGLYI